MMNAAFRVINISMWIIFAFFFADRICNVSAFLNVTRLGFEMLRMEVKQADTAAACHSEFSVAFYRVVLNDRALYQWRLRFWSRYNLKSNSAAVEFRIRRLTYSLGVKCWPRWDFWLRVTSLHMMHMVIAVLVAANSSHSNSSSQNHRTNSVATELSRAQGPGWAAAAHRCARVYLAMFSSVFRCFKLIWC